MEVGEKVGLALDAAKYYKTQMEAVGVVDVVEEVHKWPVNQWPKNRQLKEIGMCNVSSLLLDFIVSLKSYMLKDITG